MEDLEEFSYADESSRGEDYFGRKEGGDESF